MQSKNLWYGYDSMNRQTTVDGMDASLNINSAQGHKLTFDYNGNRISDTYWAKTLGANGSTAGYTTERYQYDGMNRLVKTTRDGYTTDVRFYDSASRVVQSGIDTAVGGAFLAANGLDNTYQHNQYDAAGRLIDQHVMMLKSNGALTQKSNTTYTSYDNAGNVLQYVVENFDQQHYVNTYTYTMQRFEGYVQASLSGTSTVYEPGTTTYGYDVNGNLTSVVDQKDSTKNQTLINDVDGKILERTQNGTTIRSLVVNGELMGTVGPTAGQGDFTPTYRPIDGANH
ncbi:hypothetical protein BOSP111201_13120 [Bordetella sputigena]|uniref:hypothetical protein n=1 Tax=Bordetella sputigena TaxID=1416810 RepID=UPI0039EE536E